jgi:hypothetical protein
MENGRRRTTLLVAAGGGGDALASLLVSRRLLDDDDGKVPLVASYSWDRRILDPMPGPRLPEDFEATRRLTPRSVEIIAHSRLRSGGVSSLQLLAEATTGRFVLLDPSNGAIGMRQQLVTLVEHFAYESVLLVDVGGDLLATGTEEDLRSPLADALALASLADFPVPVRVAVAGPGLDGELAASYVRSRCTASGGALSGRLAAEDVEPYFPALAQHPSEATTLLAAAALGMIGRAEIRDSMELVSLDGASAEIYVLDASAAVAANQLAQELATTHSMVEAEAATVTICGRSELDYERRKATMLLAMKPPPASEMLERLQSYWAFATARGITLATFRRLTEVLQLTTYDAELVRTLAGGRADRRLALCWTSLSR